ncbi:MAG: endo alpha-1,4 polygalactosaminidase [Pseudomonadota bacterium]
MRQIDLLRRALVGSALSAPFLARWANAEADGDRLSSIQARKLLHDARFWGCQYQNVDVDAIIASDLDLIVLDPSLADWLDRFITPKEMQALKRKPDGSRRLVLGYLPVGEADINRWYWPQAWRENSPDWVGHPNPNWPGSVNVHYWRAEWQAVVANAGDSLLKRILRMGFDGALLDRVDAYDDWATERSTGILDMVEFVQQIANIARSEHPGFLLLPQNAELLIEVPEYLALIDAHNKESLLTGLDGHNVPNDPIDIEWSHSRLRIAQAAGVRMLAIEYVSDAQIALEATHRLRELDILPFIADRELGDLPLRAPG